MRYGLVHTSRHLQDLNIKLPVGLLLFIDLLFFLSRSTTSLLPQANHNKIPTLHSIANLANHAHLETVYLEGNPCERNDRSGYRRKVILSLPQLKQVDATFVR